MIQNLPRQMLWTDMTNYSEVKSNKLCKLLDAALSLDPMNSKLSSDLGEETMLKLYNEAFYLSTRVVYEKDPEARPETYMEKILTDLGDKKMANYAIILMFYVLWQQPDKSDEVIQFTDKLQKKYLFHPSSRLLNWLNKIFKLGKNNVGFILKPSPYPADKLKDCSLNWSEITQGFSKQAITEILNLWDSDNDRGKVIRLIENECNSCMLKLTDDETTDKADETFFKKKKDLYNVTTNYEQKDDISYDFDSQHHQVHDKYRNHFIMKYANENSKDKVRCLLEKLEYFRVEGSDTNVNLDKYEFDLDKWNKNQIFAVFKDIRGFLVIKKNVFGQYILTNTNLGKNLLYETNKSIILSTILNQI